MENMGPIGVFDSGYGGLTVLRELKNQLSRYDFLYLGDNARTPYGTRSFKTVYEYSWQGVKFLLDSGCPLVIVACNTASAKALRSIQQNELMTYGQHRRVLGVLRPTTEDIGNYTRTRKVGILATSGTIRSNSYTIEIEKFFPDIRVYQQSCPMWVPLVENGEHQNKGTEYFIRKYLDKLMEQDSEIDAIVLGCTHYPLLMPLIRQYLPDHIQIISQEKVVAPKLRDYLDRHDEIDLKCSKKEKVQFLTTDSSEHFDAKASLFFNEEVQSKRVHF